MSGRMKEPCAHCPFRRDVKPFLHPKRGEELAVHAYNPYNSFACHKTTVSDEEFGGEGDEMVVTEKSRECAGFLTLQINEGADCPKDFDPSPLVYSDAYEMMEYYENPDEYFEEPE
jgi:hypothetical protein